MFDKSVDELRKPMRYITQLPMSQLQVAEYVNHTLLDILVEQCMSSDDTRARALQHLIVSHRDGNYYVIMGFEIFEAIKRLKWESALVTVHTFDTIEIEQAFYESLCETDSTGERIEFRDYSQKAISKDMIRFCKSITPDSTPEYIMVCPDDNSMENKCFDNVYRRIRSNSGKMVLGWGIAKIRNLYLEAECHAIWMTDTGKKVDITPWSNYGESDDIVDTRLFLPDDSLTPPRAGSTNSIRHMALTDSPLVIEYIGLLRKHQELSGSDIRIDERLDEIRAILIQPVGRNSPCPCQSGLKYKKCCGK
jgi:hypothetical protein